MQAPAFGMPCRFTSGGDGSAAWPAPASRPITAIRLASFGQWIWYSCDSAPGSPPSDLVSYLSQAGSNVGAEREVGSV